MTTPPVSPLLAAVLLVAAGGRLRALPLIPEAYYAANQALPWPFALLFALAAPLAFSGSPESRSIVHTVFLLAVLGAPPWLALSSAPPLLVATAGLDRDLAGRAVMSGAVVLAMLLAG